MSRHRSSPDHLGSTSYITSRNGSISQHVEYIAFGEVLFEEHSSSFSSPYLFNGKELDRETNTSYYGARYLDMKTSLWLSVDPLAEQMPGYSAYVYTFNNPVKYTDPTGMIAEPPVGVDAEDGAIHNDSSGSWKYDKASTTWVGQKNKDGKTSKNIGNTIELDNVNIKGYKSNYVPSGEYGPYRPDGIGITLSGSVDYNYTTYSVGFSLVANEKGKVGGFLTFGSGVSTSRLGAGLGASFDLIDTYGGATVFEGLKEYSKGGGASVKYLGFSHYQSALAEKGQFILNDKSGVVTNSIFLNLKLETNPVKLLPIPSTGANYGVTNTFRLF